MAGAFLTATQVAHAAVSLPALKVDQAEITVSGLSSGAVMAINMGYAYSATFKGVGIFAGTPYLCQLDHAFESCQYKNEISADMLARMQAHIDGWSGTAIDDKRHVASQKVYLFSGNKDATVGTKPMQAVQTQYIDNGVPSAQLIQRANTAHVFPTDFRSAGNNLCSVSLPPYISDCGYDGAGAALSLFYGKLKARNDSPPEANYLEFNQREFTGNLGMAATGWAYIPEACASGASCKLHVAFHGCLQSTSNIGKKFVKNTGYTRWADTNQIVVLFPQARADKNKYTTPANGVTNNPNACWDTIGLYGADYAQRSGAQLSAIKAMVDRLASAPLAQ